MLPGTPHGAWPRAVAYQAVDRIADDLRDFTANAGSKVITNRTMRPLFGSTLRLIARLGDQTRIAQLELAVHFQFAPWVVNNEDGRAHVEHCGDVMEGFTLAAEFRHKSWFSEGAQNPFVDT